MTTDADDGFTPRTELAVRSLSDLAAFLALELKESMTSQGVTASPPTEAYLGGILMRFAKPETLHNRAEGRATHQLLFKMRHQAASTPDAGARYASYRDLGDLSLFMAGFFYARVRRGVMGEEYYVEIGRRAYATVATIVAARQGKEVVEMYAEMADRFPLFRNAFEETADRVRIDGDRSLIRLCERMRDPRRVHQVLRYRGMVLLGPKGVQ